MAGPRKGFTSERHAGLKAAVAALAVVGFAAGWAGFSNAHSEAVDDGVTSTASPPPAATGTPTLPVRTPTPSSPRTIVPTATVSGAPPEPSATRAPRRSRGS